MCQIAGYTAADYLIQHATRDRRYARPPADTWRAVLSHVSDPADAARLGDSAERRLLYRYAIPLYRQAADADHEDGTMVLAGLLTVRGDIGEATQILRARPTPATGMRPGGWPSCWPRPATWTGRHRYCGPGRRRRRVRRPAVGQSAG